MDLQLVDEILERYPHYRTCSIWNPRQECVSYIKRADLRVVLAPPFPDTNIVIVPPGCQADQMGLFTVYEHPEPEYVFTVIHNALNAGKLPAEDTLSPYAEIDPDASIGAEGFKMAQAAGMPGVYFKHMGCVKIDDHVRVGPQAVIHRACLDDTRIERQAFIGAQCNVAHNVIIGAHAVLTAGVMVGGSARIGANCFIGMGAVIQNGVSICPETMIGQGSVVTRSIKRPGVYYGSPARYIKPWNGRWGLSDADRVYRQNLEAK